MYDLNWKRIKLDEDGFFDDMNLYFEDCESFGELKGFIYDKKTG